MSPTTEHQQIEISAQPIALCQLLKIANLVSGGGEAKIVISEGYVLLNDEVEYQKRKKVYHNDIVEFNGDVIQVVVTDNANNIDEEKVELVITPVKNKKAKAPKTSPTPSKKVDHTAQASNSPEIINESIPAKRKPISF